MNNEKGITLVALVVTIIVLIILAGVSISLVLGENGIITKSKYAKQETLNAQVAEQEQLNEATSYLENMGEIKNPTGGGDYEEAEPEGPSEIVIVESNVVQEGEYDYNGDACYAHIPSFNVEVGKTYHITYNEGYEIDVVASQRGFDLLLDGIESYRIEPYGLITRYGGNMGLYYIKITAINQS